MNEYKVVKNPDGSDYFLTTSYMKDGGILCRDVEMMGFIITPDKVAKFLADWPQLTPDGPKPSDENPTIPSVKT